LGYRERIRHGGGRRLRSRVIAPNDHPTSEQGGNGGSGAFATVDPHAGDPSHIGTYRASIGYADVVASTITSGAVVEDPVATPGPILRCSCELAG
jgi:hypothetical protein